MEIAFTGTQAGMTNAQKAAFKKLLVELGVKTFHHGDCIGADADAHSIAHELGSIDIIIHPPSVNTKRAYCSSTKIMPPEEYLVRNRRMVNLSVGLIATPKVDYEVLRSGTWMTVRYAVKSYRPVWIIWPNGSVKKLAGKSFPSSHVQATMFRDKGGE